MPSAPEKSNKLNTNNQRGHAAQVPSEFVVQRNTNANPPTLFLAIESLMQGLRRTDDLPAADKRFLHKIYPRLQAWFDWFNTTQTGPVPFSYRWRGRDAVTDSELNPKTLTSGLDDYPRASHPSSDERHIDLRCWMALASGTMAKIAAIVQPDDAERYEETHRALTDPVVMNRLHWSAEMGVFSDFGNHTDRVALTRKLFQPAVAGQPPVSRVVRVARKKPQPRFVDAFGYVALFPFLLQQLAPDSPQLRQILADLRAEEVLWSRFGLRSLSARDPLYMKSNTEHDPPYWRGQVWINVNFLAVRALRHYADVAGPQRARARELYGELRENLVRNVHAQYARTGYLWEQYNDATGKGQGTHPFTGWSALVVLIMSEQF